MFGNYAAAALRNLARNGLYAAVTISGLAIGFAAAILIGLYVRHEATYDRFVPNHQRIFLVSVKIDEAAGGNIDSDVSSPLLAAELKLAFPQVQYVARLDPYPLATIRKGQLTVSEPGFVWADPDFFKLFAAPALAGDPAAALEAPDALVLSRSSARKYFGRDTPIGGVLLVDGHPMRVAAVIEDIPSNSNLVGDVFASARSPYSQIGPTAKFGYGSLTGPTYVMLKPGASLAQVQAALPAFVERRIRPALEHDLPPNLAKTYALSLKPLTALHLHPAGRIRTGAGGGVAVLGGLAAIGVLIVVVAAINFVTLMSARASRRAVEVGVRKAVGARRADLMIQFMGEALLYVVLALVLAVAIAELLLPALNAVLQRRMSFDYLHDPALLAALVAVALVTGLAAGAWPALVLSAYRPAAVLKGGPIAVGGGGRARQALVVAQFSVLIALVVAAGTIARQTLFALNDATHADTSNVALLLASPCSTTLRDAVAALPGVREAACSSPMAIGRGFNHNAATFEGRQVTVNYVPVDFGFFEVYGVRPLAGRLFQSARPGDDGAQLHDAAPPVVINAAAARALGAASPRALIGRTISWRFRNGFSYTDIPPPRSSQIIGVVPDFSFGSVRQTVEPVLFYVAAKTGQIDSIALNVKLDPAQLKTTLPEIDRVWREVTGGLPEQRVYASQFLLLNYLDTLVQGGFIAACALVAVVIACLGLFALAAYTAERRTKEIGVRKAMGARSSDVLRLLLRQFVTPVLLANVIAWPVAFLAMRWWLQGFAYHVDQTVWTFAAAGLAAVVIGLGTVAVQSYRAARTRPVTALRDE